MTNTAQVDLESGRVDPLPVSLEAVAAARAAADTCSYGLADIARHVIGCHLNQETRIRSACRMTWRQ